MFADARIAQGLRFIAEDPKYVIEICESATAKLEKRKARKTKTPIEQFNPVIQYCNDCGKPRGWSLTFRLDNRSTCNLCGELKPCSTGELPDAAEMVTAWKQR